MQWNSYLQVFPLQESPAQQASPFLVQRPPSAIHAGAGAGAGSVGGAGAGSVGGSIVTWTESLPLYLYCPPQLMSSTVNTKVP